MSLIRKRRTFLKTALVALTGALVPARPARGASEALPNFGGIPDAGVTPSHSQELLVRLADVDGVRLRTASEKELPSGTGAALHVFRYEPPGGVSRTIDRVILPWMDVRGGVYVRSAIPYRLRVSLDRDDGKLATAIVLGRRASVAVYRETPRWIDTPPWQVVVVVTGQHP